MVSDKTNGLALSDQYGLWFPVKFLSLPTSSMLESCS